MKQRPGGALPVAGATGAEGECSSDDLEVGHHPGGVVLEDVAVIHPAAWSVVRQPTDPDPALGRDVDGVLPGSEGRRGAVDLEHLEEEAVQVEGVVHLRLV